MTHLSVVPGRTSQTGLRPRLGKQAAKRRGNHLNLLEGPRAASWIPPARPLCRDQRVKVRWTEAMIARFKVEAMRCANNIELAKRLGLPAYCEGSMRAARSRYFRHATVKAPSRPTGRPRTLQMALAA